MCFREYWLPTVTLFLYSKPATALNYYICFNVLYLWIIYQNNRDFMDNSTSKNLMPCWVMRCIHIQYWWMKLLFKQGLEELYVHSNRIV